MYKRQQPGNVGTAGLGKVERLAVKGELACVGSLQKVQTAQQGGLAGAGGAEDGHHIALFHGQVHACLLYTSRFTMYVKEVTVENQVGLHARPATFFIQKANEFKSSIWVEKEERRVNAKSLLGVLSLGIVGGTTIRIIADGADEQAAVDGLIKLVESGFAE